MINRLTITAVLLALSINSQVMAVNESAPANNSTAVDASAKSVSTDAAAKAPNDEIAAPDFKAKDADGKEYTLASLNGKVVVIEFTNPGSPVSNKPGCPFMVSRYKAGNMQKLAARIQDMGATYLACNSSYFNTPEDTKAVAKEMNVTYPTLQDADGKVASAFHAKTTPHMFVISKDGKIVYQGALNDNATPDADKDASAKNYVIPAVAAALKGEKPEVTNTKSYGCGIKYKE